MCLGRRERDGFSSELPPPAPVTTRHPKPFEPGEARPSGDAPRLEELGRYRRFVYESRPSPLAAACAPRKGSTRRRDFELARRDARGAEPLPGCDHASCRVVEIDRRRRALRNACAKASKPFTGRRGRKQREQGLAQSGRPRRAKRRRGVNRGGETARSPSPERVGSRKRLLGEGTIDRSRFGSSKPRLFHERWGTSDLGLVQSQLLRESARAVDGRGDGSVRGG